MNEKKELYPKINDMPYSTTKVSVHDSRKHIIQLLEKYGITSHVWGNIEGKEAIQFQIDTIVQGAQIKKMVRIDIPIIKARKWNKGRYEIISVPKAHILRFIYYNLKSILEASQYGIFRLEHLLMSYILVQLQDGSKIQIKDLLEDHPLLLSTGMPLKQD